MREGRRDAAISDITGTLMMVGAVVLAGGLLTVVVTDGLRSTPSPEATLALAPLDPGDTALRLVLKAGDDLALAGLTVSLTRGTAAAVTVPRSSWSAPDAQVLHAGERLSIPLSPPAAANERILVTVGLVEANELLATLAATPAPTTTSLGAATIVAQITPSSIFADGAGSGKLAVRVSHPAGAGAVARVTADLFALGPASGTANRTVDLNDAGLDGDLVGGDGNWSALLRPAATTAAGTYPIVVNATALDGTQVATTTLQLTITGALGSAGGSPGGSGGSGSGGGFTGNFQGSCYGCTITGGAVILEGTRLPVPPSASIQRLKFTNWTWDRLHPEALQNDAAVARIVSDTWSWSIYLKFVYSTQTGNVPALARMEVWNANATTVYLPNATNVNRVPLAGLSLDLLNPTSSGFVCSTGCSPQMTYNNADIRGAPVFFVSYLRDETNNFQTTEIGIQSIDAVMT